MSKRPLPCADQYLSKICRFKKIDEREVRELLKKKPKNRVLNEIVERNLKLAWYLAGQWARTAARHGVSHADLVGAANLALVQAVRKYNPSLGYFHKYICSYIRSYVEAEVCKHLNYGRLEIKKRLKNGLDVNPTDSLEKVISDDGEGGALLLQDILPSPLDSKEQMRLDVQDLIATLGRLKNRTHPLAKIIIQLRCGAGHNEPMSLSKIASIVKLSTEAIRKIELKTLALLRNI